MKKRDYLINQIEHREIDSVPDVLNIEDSVTQRFAQYYNGKNWRDIICASKK